MTAEVVVMNRSAVALAADSKVTIGGEKTYDTVNKIFTLSKVHPIGVMVFGNADFMHYPWELMPAARTLLNFPSLTRDQTERHLLTLLENWKGPRPAN